MVIKKSATKYPRTVLTSVFSVSCKISIKASIPPQSAIANCRNKHSFKQSEWIFSNRDLNVKSLGLIFVFFVQGTKEWTYKQVFILRHVNRNLFYDILKKGTKEWLSYSVGVMSHTERKIPQKTNGSISDTPFRMPQQSYDNWNTTELSVN